MLPQRYNGKAIQFPENYDADFLHFCQTNLPDARKFWVSDIDAAGVFTLRNKTGLMLLEIKRNGYPAKAHQKIGMRIISTLLRHGIEKTGGVVRIHFEDDVKEYRVKYFGYNTLTLSGASFLNSSFKWNSQDVTKKELIELMTFKRVL